MPKEFEPGFGDKIGTRAAELFRGALLVDDDGSMQLALEGYQTQDPAGMIEKGQYELLVVDRAEATGEVKTMVGTCAGAEITLERAKKGKRKGKKGGKRRARRGSLSKRKPTAAQASQVIAECHESWKALKARGPGDTGFWLKA